MPAHVIRPRRRSAGRAKEAIGISPESSEGNSNNRGVGQAYAGAPGRRGGERSWREGSSDAADLCAVYGSRMIHTALERKIRRTTGCREY